MSYQLGSSNPILSQDTQDLVKSALGTPAAQQQLVNAVLDIQMSQLDSSVLQSVSVTLSSAQILALNSTPVTIVPAPAAGMVNLVVSALGTLTYNSSAYTGSNAMTLNYTNGSGVSICSFPTSGFLDASANAAYSAMAASGLVTAAAPIVASVASANPAAGNSPVTIQVFYRVVPF